MDALKGSVPTMRSWGLGGESVPMGLMRRMQEVRCIVVHACTETLYLGGLRGL